VAEPNLSDADLAIYLAELESGAHLSIDGQISLIRELLERRECERLKASWEKVAWDRTPGYPDVPVLQERYDRLKTDRDRLVAENAALRQAIAEINLLCEAAYSGQNVATTLRECCRISTAALAPRPTAATTGE
jgi:hypothetical protein